jgi:hypothetical protein
MERTSSAEPALGVKPALEKPLGEMSWIESLERAHYGQDEGYDFSKDLRL